MSTETDKKTEMVNELTAQAEKLREELMNLEREFNIKKEQFIKIQGALEAINILSEA